MRSAQSRPPSRVATTTKTPAFGALFVNRQRRHLIKTERIRAVLQGAAAAMNVNGELTIVFAGDSLLQRLNRDYRFKDKPTDVLSFEGQGGEMGLGDVVISVETARGNAVRFGRTLDQELEILALHGFLHAVGYDHESDEGQMEALEKKLRKRFLTRKNTPVSKSSTSTMRGVAA